MLLRWPEQWEEAQARAGRAVAVTRGTELPPPIVSELRDIFHTLVDAAGIAGNATLVPPYATGDTGHFKATDGKSLLCLLADPTGRAHCDYAPNPGPWRLFLDMEHSTCYNASNHWSALTDGATKYVYRAWVPDEQLFNLSSDPHESTEVSGDPAYAAALVQWRQRLVAQFEREGRGDAWVKDGKLLQRAQGQTYSPNYPKAPPPAPAPAPKAGDAVVLRPNGGTASCRDTNTNDCWADEREATSAAPSSGTAATATATATAAASRLALVRADSQAGSPELCLSVAGAGAAAAGSGLSVEACAAPSATAAARARQAFTTRNHTTETTAALHTAGDHRATSDAAFETASAAAGAAVVHTPSGLCVSGGACDSGGAATLQACDGGAAGQQWAAAAAPNQQWVFGASGRLCACGLCLHAA